MKILFASSNKNKVFEISQMLPINIELITLDDIDLQEEIPETSATIEGNAIEKVNFIHSHFGLDCFADDTGLEVKALNGAPGVKSARYAGNDRNNEENINLVLSQLESFSDRRARFKTVIALHLHNKQYLFEGIVEGVIIKERKGQNGFGYDSIFEPENSGKTFGEMKAAEKNSYSHRARALTKMITFLNSI